MSKQGIAIHTYANPLRSNNNARLMRIVETLGQLDLFDKVVVITGRDSDQERSEPLFENVFARRYKGLKSRKESLLIKIFRGLLWISNIYSYSLFKRVKVINYVGPLELFTVPFFKYIKKSKTIYYADDIVTENRLSPSMEKIYSYLEGKYLPKCDKVIVVSEGIKSWYEKKYNIENVEVIWNAPSRWEDIQKKRELKDVLDLPIPKESVKFGYIGTLTTGRGLDILMRAFSKLSSEKHLLIAGYGPEEKKVKEMAENFENIHYIGPVDWDKVIQYTNSLDVGLVVLENVSLNYYHALPTKLFEYLASGKPSIVSNFPDMSKIIEMYDCGWQVEPNYDSLFELLNSLTMDDVMQKKKNLGNHVKKFIWENQCEKLVNMYSKLLE
jgi:glycosyltransferase involved in cell wall biosynthesis